MELNTNKNFEDEATDFGGRPNPNDAIFGGVSIDEPYQIRSTYVPAPAKKSSSPIIAIVIVIICAGIIGGVIHNMKKAEKEARRFDGTYVLTKMEVDDFSMDIEQFGKMTGATFEGSVKIDGKEGYVELSLEGAGVNKSTEGEAEVKLEGNTIYLKGPGGTLTFEFYENGDEDYITFDVDGNYLYFYKEN